MYIQLQISLQKTFTYLNNLINFEDENIGEAKDLPRQKFNKN